MTSHKKINKVWHAFKQMKDYIENGPEILTHVNSENYFQSVDNKILYDGVSTLLNSNIGHVNTEIISSISSQLKKLDNATLFTSTNTTSIECSQRLCRLCDDHYFSTFFTNSGSEACDTALKIVLKYWRNKNEHRNVIISLNGAYHGSSIGAMMIANGGFNNDDFNLECSNFHQINVPNSMDISMDINDEINNCLDEFKSFCSVNKGKIAALFLELTQLSNGANVLPLRYVEEIYKISKQEGILLVIDEVATGFGRTGKMFDSQNYNIWGDIMMTAIAITSGYFPLGAVLVTEEVYMAFYGDTQDGKHLEHGYTTGGHPVACAAALANINIIEKNNLIANSSEKGNLLLNKLRNELLCSPLVRCIRGKGLIQAIIFEEIRIKNMEAWGIAEILSKFLSNRGLLLYPDDTNILIVAPPLTVNEEECSMIVEKLKDAIKKIEFLLQMED